MATVGTARNVTCVPNWLTVSPAQSFKKSGWRHNSPRSIARFYRERRLVAAALHNDSGSIRNLVIGLLLVAVPFGIVYLLTRTNSNAEVLLIVAVFCVGLALLFAMASGLQHVGAVAIRLSGRSPLDIMIVGLAALSLLTPWTIEVAVGNLYQVFGWINPLGWVVAICLLLSVMQSARPYHGVALTVAGVALVAWGGWGAWLLTSPSFRNLPFTFVPVDILSTGWRSEEHTSELQSRSDLVCRLLLENKIDNCHSAWRGLHVLKT